VPPGLEFAPKPLQLPADVATSRVSCRQVAAIQSRHKRAEVELATSARLIDRTGVIHATHANRPDPVAATASWLPHN
jgi:hypothetical protein